MKRQIFISYSRKDAIITSLLRQDLRDYPIFCDRDIAPGDNWWETICKNIESSDLILFVDTLESYRSIFCKAELEYAISLERTVIPIRMPEDHRTPLSMLEKIHAQIFFYDVLSPDRSSNICRAVNNAELSPPIQCSSPQPEDPTLEVKRYINDLQTKYLDSGPPNEASQDDMVVEIERCLLESSLEVRDCYLSNFIEIENHRSFLPRPKVKFLSIKSRMSHLTPPSPIYEEKAWSTAAEGDVNNLAAEIKSGLIIPFFGPGLTPEVFSNKLEQDIVDLIGQFIFPSNWPNSKPESNLLLYQKRNELTSEIFGFPCSGCHFYIEERPAYSNDYMGCPMLKGWPVGSKDTPMYTEQQLAIAIRNIRYLADYYLYINSATPAFQNLNNLITTTVRNETNPDPFGVYEFFLRLPEGLEKPHLFDLWLTANFTDTRYFSPAALDFYFNAGMVFEENQTIVKEKVVLWPNTELKHDSRIIKNMRPTEAYGCTTKLEQTIVLSLYGKATANAMTSPILSGRHFNMLLTAINALPKKILSALSTRPLLLIGFSKNDFEIQQVVSQIQAKVGTEIKLYLVYQKSTLGDETHMLSTKAWNNIKGYKYLIPVSSIKDFIRDFKSEYFNSIF